jgi:glycosyltransferase involved in cell wall biosynthesis
MKRAPWDGIFVDHPVGPIEAKDPLSGAAAAVRPGPRSPDPAGPRIGYASAWEEIPQRSWSGSSWNLREGLRKVSDTVDIGVEFPAMTRKALRIANARYKNGRLTTSWWYSPLTDAYLSAALRRGLKQQSRYRAVDAVLQVEFLSAIMPIPFYSYADCSWDALFSSVAQPAMYADLMELPPSNLLRRRDRQLAMYERAAGVITMSHWFARSLVKQSGVPPQKIHVVHPGFSAGRTAAAPRPLPDRPGPRRRLLFVGRQNTSYAFYRKGGDQVVAALSILRREYDPQLTLTIVGLDEWPLPGPVPDGVNLLGPLPPDQVSRLYDEHDLFVMPSRQEAFGIVFTEALSRGLPCVARNSFAMPEIITPGVSGALVDSEEAEPLAKAIISVLSDDEIYRQCAARAPEIAAYFSWERTARDIADVIAGSTSARGQGMAAGS